MAIYQRHKHITFEVFFVIISILLLLSNFAVVRAQPFDDNSVMQQRLQQKVQKFHASAPQWVAAGGSTEKLEALAKEFEARLSEGKIYEAESIMDHMLELIEAPSDISRFSAGSDLALNEPKPSVIPEKTLIPPISAKTQYLAFQIFTSSFDDSMMRQNIPTTHEDIRNTVDGIIRAIGTVGSKNRKLGFVPGPLAFDHTDDQIRQLMRDSFAIALEKNIAVGFHIDDSMLWGRLSNLNRIENIEWLDWNKTPNTGRRLDWSSTPTKIMPQLCVNSPAVKAEVEKRAAIIGAEVKRGLETLKSAGKEHLFIGIIAGWETQIGRDFDTGKYLGYCALTNKGYNVGNPPADIDEARADIVKEFVDFWTKSLADAGVADEKIFSHTAFMSKSVFDFVKFSQPEKFPRGYLETISFAPPRVAFGPYHSAGFSTYPQIGLIDQILAESAKNGDAPWISAEGTAIDPGQAERGEGAGSMEEYLGGMFNHGAILVNIFGWGVGPSDNPFRKVAENKNAIQAYQKFFRGEKLNEDTAQAQIPSSQFFSKMQKLQKELPAYLNKQGPKKIGVLHETLNQNLNLQRYNDAEENIDEILKIIEE